MPVTVLCVYLFILVCYNDKFSINMNTKENILFGASLIGVLVDLVSFPPLNLHELFDILTGSLGFFWSLVNEALHGGFREQGEWGKKL